MCAMLLLPASAAEGCVTQVYAVCCADHVCHSCRSGLDVGLCCVFCCPCLAELQGMLWLLWTPKTILSDCSALELSLPTSAPFHIDVYFAAPAWQSYRACCGCSGRLKQYCQTAAPWN